MRIRFQNLYFSTFPVAHAKNSNQLYYLRETIVAYCLYVCPCISVCMRGNPAFLIQEKNYSYLVIVSKDAQHL